MDLYAQLIAGNGLQVQRVRLVNNYVPARHTHKHYIHIHINHDSDARQWAPSRMSTHYLPLSWQRGVRAYLFIVCLSQCYIGRIKLEWIMVPVCSLWFSFCFEGVPLTDNICIPCTVLRVRRRNGTGAVHFHNKSNRIFSMNFLKIFRKLMQNEFWYDYIQGDSYWNTFTFRIDIAN